MLSSSTPAKIAANTCILALNTKCIIKQECIKDFQQALCSNAIQTLAEPGCLQFVVGKADNNNNNNNNVNNNNDNNNNSNNIFYIHNQFMNLEAYKEHETSLHFLGFLQKVEPMLEAPTVTNKFLLHSDDDNDSDNDNDDDSKTATTTTTTTTKPSPPIKTYCLNVESCIKPELRHDFIKLVQQHAVKSRNEISCLQFDWGESIDTLNHFYMHEEYKDKTGFHEHEISKHFSKFMNFNNEKQPYIKPQDVGFYETVKI